MITRALVIIDTIVFLALGATTVFADDTAEYTLTGQRWAHTAITHNVDAYESQALAVWGSVSAITDGGVSTNPDISVSSAPMAAGVGGYAQWFPDSTGRWVTHCNIVNNSIYPPSMTVYIHETGHCLGLNHSDHADAIMAWDGGNTLRLTADDIAGIQALYGPPVPAPPPPPPPPPPALPFRVWGVYLGHD